MEIYECDLCGACCTQLIVEISELDVIREPRLKEVAKPFRVELDMVCEDEDGEIFEPIEPKFVNGAMLACGSRNPCKLGSATSGVHRCSIYPSRPNVCVGFRAGSEQCQMARGMAKLPPLQPMKEVKDDQ